MFVYIKDNKIVCISEQAIEWLLAEEFFFKPWYYVIDDGVMRPAKEWDTEIIALSPPPSQEEIDFYNNRNNEITKMQNELSNHNMLYYKYDEKWNTIEISEEEKNELDKQKEDMEKRYEELINKHFTPEK